jgi:hypothetical protein
LPGNSDSDKKEFLADVSSFANANGGDLVYGIGSDNTSGAPQLLEGMNISNVDQEIVRLDNSIRDGIEPRITGIAIKSIPLANTNIVLVIRIPKSWNLPHRVTYKGHDKFYSRSTNGKYPLDVNELRNAFSLSSSIADKIRNFRIERISKILADDVPFSLMPSPKSVLHIIPISALNPAQSYNLSESSNINQKLRPISHGGWNHRYNLDGIATSSPIVNGKYYSYTQLFKNGIVEAVEASMMEPYGMTNYIPSTMFEESLIDALSNYLELLNDLGVNLPAYIFLSVLGVKGFHMAVGGYRNHPQAIDRDHLLIPESIIDNYDVPSEIILRNSFDSVWNACGYSGSENYDENGTWRRR